MPIKRPNPKITPEEYLKKLMYVNARTNLMIKRQSQRIMSLNDEYAKHYSSHHANEILAVEPGTIGVEEGYTEFVVGKVVPVVKEKANGVPGAFRITFELYGTYRGEGKENKTGKVIPTETIE